jgi:hypothetical protein
VNAGAQGAGQEGVHPFGCLAATRATFLGSHGGVWNDVFAEFAWASGVERHQVSISEKTRCHEGDDFVIYFSQCPDDNDETSG